MGPVQLFASGIVDGEFPGEAWHCSNNHVYHPPQSGTGIQDLHWTAALLSHVSRLRELESS